VVGIISKIKLSRECDDIPTVPGSNPGGEIL